MNTWLLRLVIVLMAWNPAFAAEAKLLDFKDSEIMRFALVRLADPACEPDCPQWISADGAIDVGTAAAFSSFMRKLARKNPGLKPPVVLNSPGGVVEDGIEMGRAIRKYGLDTAVGRTTFIGCAPKAKDCKLDPKRDGIYAGTLTHWSSACSSACIAVFAGGARRVAPTPTGIGIHAIAAERQNYKTYYRIQYKIKNGKKIPVKKSVVKTVKVGAPKLVEGIGKSLRKKLAALFRDAGVKAELIDEAQATPHSKMRWLDANERVKFNLATETKSLEFLVSAQMCAAPGRPPSCFAATGDLAAALAPPAKPAVAPATGTPKIPGAPKPRRSTAGAVMTFTRVRSAGAGCEPLCPEWIQADGWIASETSAQFAAFLAANDDIRLPLLVSSFGGDMHSAIEMAKIIRARGLDVAVGETRYLSCKAAPSACDSDAPVRIGSANITNVACLGACTAMLASGSKRLKGAYYSTISMHKMRPEPDGAPPGVFLVPSNSVEETPENVNLLRGTMTAMGIDAAIVDKGVNPNQTLGYYGISGLGIDALLQSRLVTSQDSPDTLTAVVNCKAEVPAANCVRR